VPRIVQGLPAGGKRLLPDSSIVAGVPTYLDGRETGALPGRLARGRRPGPLRQAA
jgi:N-acyl-D-amino-acid deacylase